MIEKNSWEKGCCDLRKVGKKFHVYMGLSNNILYGLFIDRAVVCKYHQLWFPKVLDLNVSLACCWHAYTPFQNDWDVSMKQCLFPQPDEKKKRNIYYHPELKIVYTFNKLAGYLKNVICFSDDVTLLFLDIASILQDSHKLHLSNKVKQLTDIGTACLDVVAIVSVVVSVCIFFARVT